MSGLAKTSGLIHEELSYSVIGCAQNVHRSLGPGFPERIYQKALAHELVKRKIVFQSEAGFEVAYEGMICGQFRVDVLVDSKIILELKALDALCKQHESQLLAYLKATGCPVGLLMNFGEQSLKVKRFVM